MIVRAALAALACLAARVAGQAKQCDPDVPEIIFRKERIDDAASNGKAVLAADLNGDGDIDIAAAMHGDNKFKWYKNDLFTGPNGNISFAAHDVVTGAIISPNGVQAADVDGDGDVDLLLSYGTSDSNSFLQWYENDKAAGGVPYDNDARLHVISTGDPAVNSQTYMVKPVMAHGIDVDGDGDVDVTAVAQGSNRVNLFTNDLDATGPVRVEDFGKDAPSEEELVRASLPDFVLGLYNAPRFGLQLIWENHSLTSLYSVYEKGA